MCSHFISSAQYTSSTQRCLNLSLCMLTLLKCVLTVLVQILFTVLVTLLLMSVDNLYEKEFTRTKKKFEGLTQSVKG